jgi:DNA-binding Xre family transcriptional regulator
MAAHSSIRSRPLPRSEVDTALAIRDGFDLARHREWFAQNLQRLLDTRQMRARALAKELNVSESDVSRWRKGSIPGDETLEALAEYFGVEVSDLLKNPDSKVKTLAEASMVDLLTEMSKRVGVEVKKN